MKKVIILVLIAGLVLSSMATIQAIFDRDYVRSVVTLIALILLTIATSQKLRN